MTTVAAGRSKTYDLVYIAVFAVVMAVCSWISIPAQVPFTLQTFGVFMAVGVLGGKRGTLAVLVYVLLGAVGVPVFAGFSGGIGALLGNAGGYIIGFIFSALVMWAIEHVFGRKPVVQIISMIVGLIVCYAFGTAWFMFAYTRSTGPVGLMAVGVLGGKRGTLAVLVYVLLGAVGVPVFAGFSGGIGSLLGNAGGYIIGFIFSALVMWAIESVFGRKPVVQIISMIIGLIVCYAFGTAWFMFAYTRSTGPVGLMAVLGWCVFPFIIPDLIKIALAYVLSGKVRKYAR